MEDSTTTTQQQIIAHYILLQYRMNATKFSDISITKVVIDLETISKIQKGETLDTTGEFLRIIGTGSYANSLMRSFNGDSRLKALQKITNLVYLAYEFAERILESKHLDIKGSAKGFQSDEQRAHYKVRIDWLMRINNSLGYAINGLSNLSITYRDDQVLEAKIYELIKKIQRKFKYLDNAILEIQKIKELASDPKYSIEALFHTQGIS